ncbi:MAG: hypothetical protein ACPHRO_11915 [Nannocystaceae bacterium]
MATGSDGGPEPRLALIGGDDGLDVIRTLATQSLEYLQPGGSLIVEHGFDQGAAVRDVFSRAGLENPVTYQDLGGNDRITSATRP